MSFGSYECWSAITVRSLFYDAGVGTLVAPAAISKFRKFVSRRLDAAIGLRVRENSIVTYRFLVRTFQTGDQIYFFGFSRGASLATLCRRQPLAQRISRGGKRLSIRVADQNA